MACKTVLHSGILCLCFLNFLTLPECGTWFYLSTLQFGIFLVTPLQPGTSRVLLRVILLKLHLSGTETLHVKDPTILLSTPQIDSICSASSGMGLSLRGSCIECGIEDAWDVIHCDEGYNEGPGGTFCGGDTRTNEHSRLCLVFCGYNFFFFGSWVFECGKQRFNDNFGFNNVCSVARWKWTMLIQSDRNWNTSKATEHITHLSGFTRWRKSLTR